MTCKNFLTPNKFKLQIKKLPNFEQYVQSVTVPTISVGPTQGLPNPFQKIQIAGEHMSFNELQVKFKVDEDMDNYFEIFTWMQGLGKPQNYDQYKRLAAAAPGSGEGPQVDGTLHILNSQSDPSRVIQFYDMWPTELSGFELDYTLDQIEYVTATVTFIYTQFAPV